MSEVLTEAKTVPCGKEDECFSLLMLSFEGVARDKDFAINKMHEADRDRNYFHCKFLDEADKNKKLVKRILELIERLQLGASNSAVRPDIKQGHWMACASIREQIMKEFQ